MKQIRQQIGSFALVALGAVIAAFAIEEFLAPNNIMDGGIVGISMVVDVFVPMPLSVLTLLFNLPFLWVGYRQMGKLFLGKAAFAIAVFSGFLQILSLIHI